LGPGSSALPQGWHSRRHRLSSQVRTSPLEQLDRARANGVHFAWSTPTSGISKKPKFLAGLEERQHRYVVEIPRNLQRLALRSGTNPRHPARSVQELCQQARPMTNQEWVPFHIKTLTKVPRSGRSAAPFWLQRGDQVLGPYWAESGLTIPCTPKRKKFFLSNAPRTPAWKTLLHVAFARWPIERCWRTRKSELGLSHFEVAKYLALLRHLLIHHGQPSVLGRQTQRLRGEKSSHHQSAKSGDAANALIRHFAVPLR